MTAGGDGRDGRLEHASSDPEPRLRLLAGTCFAGTPRVRLTTSLYGRDYRIGYSLGVLEQRR